MILYWIDDEYDKISHRTPGGASKRFIESGLNVALQIELFATHTSYAEFIDELREDQTYGVLMDYRLTNVGANSGSEYGTTWAAQLRALKPSIPIIGVSSEKREVIPKFRMENFLDFFDRRVFLDGSPPLGQLKALFEGYRTIWTAAHKSKSGSGLDLMMELIQPPREAAELLRVAIPPSLRGEWDDETPHAATRWIWHQLQGVSGFLFDAFEAATFLGLKEEAFLEFEATSPFIKARFNGVLACNDRIRWWASLMRPAAEEQVKQRLVGPVSQSRDILLRSFGIPEQSWVSKFAQPYGRTDYPGPPECVAFPDQNSKNERRLDDRVPALLKDTKIDEIDGNPPLGFQPPRHFNLDADQ